MNKNLALELSQRVQRIKPSPTLAVSARAEELQAQGKPIINLGVGEPDFDTPEHIKEAAIKAMRDGHTKYTVVDGIKPLRQAISNKFAEDNQLQYALNQILVSNGAKHSIYNAFAAILNPGDEVIIPAPYWVSYPDMVKLADAIPVILDTDLAHHFKLTPDQLQAAITNKTRIVILNSPSNPTGIAYTASELAALAEIILAHPRIFVISDDIYEKNIWTPAPFANVLMVCPDLYDQCLIVNGVSKTYAMTGWRIGYAAGPATLIAAMKKIQSQSTSNPASISQYAALAALEGDQTCVDVMTEAYKQRHDYLLSEWQNLKGFQCLPSDGTFFAFPSIKALLNENMPNDIAFTEFLLDEAEVAVIPGSAFGAPHYIRVSYATHMENLQSAIARIRKVITTLF